MDVHGRWQYSDWHCVCSIIDRKAYEMADSDTRQNIAELCWWLHNEHRYVCKTYDGLFMAAVRSRCGRCIFVLFLLLLSFFRRLISAVADWVSIPYFYTWCCPSANLECRSEMCCMRLARNARSKNSPSGHHRTTLSGYILTSKAYIDNRKKLVKQQYLPHMSSQYGELTAH